MTEAPQTAAELLRAEEAAIARRKAEHDQPILDAAVQILSSLEAAIEALAALSPSIITPWVAPQITALVNDYGRAVEAVNGAVIATAEALAEPEA